MMAELNDQLEEYPDSVYKLIEKASRTGITGGDDKSSINNCTDKNETGHRLPPWLDPQAIQKGRAFVSKHFFLVFFTHFISLILLLSYVPVRAVLIKTGKSHTKDKALRRYLSTLRHVKLWYESDLSVHTSEAVQDVVKVRKIHAGVSKRMEAAADSKDKQEHGISVLYHSNEDTKAARTIKTLASVNRDGNNNKTTGTFVDDTTSIPKSITQLDMIVTQFCFMGLLTTYPKKFGVGSSPEDIEGLQGFSHIWAVVGYLLGIENDFNLCIGVGQSDKTAVSKFILKEILLPNLFATKETTYNLWEALVTAMSEFVPCLSIHAALLYILDHTLEYENGDQLYSSANLYEKCSYQLKITLFTQVFHKIPLVRQIFNNLLRLAIYLTTLRLRLSKIT